MRFSIVINEEDLYNILLEESHNITTKIFNSSQQNIIDNGTSDEGTLLKSGNSYLNNDGGEIVYDAPHANSIEYGARPHRIYSGWLHGWVRRKLGITDEKKVKKVAYAIALSIEKNGIDAQPFLEPAISSVRNDYEGVRS